MEGIGFWKQGIGSGRRGISISKKCKRRIKWTGEEFTLMANQEPQIKPEPNPQAQSFLFCSKGSQDNPCSLMKNGTKKRKPKGLTPLDPDTIRVQRYYCRTHQRFFTEIPSSLLPRVHYTAPVVTFSLDYFIFPNYLKYRRTKHLSRGRAWRKEPKIHSILSVIVNFPKHTPPWVQNVCCVGCSWLLDCCC